MSWLAVIPEDDPERRLSRSSEPRAIAAMLARVGARFERWPLSPPGVDPLAAYAAPIEGLRAAGYGTIDVVSVAPDATELGFSPPELVIPIVENQQDTRALAVAVSERLRRAPAPAYLVAGHGLTTWGSDPASVLRHVEALEFMLACELAELTAS